jgi:hypothetical protein
MDHRYLERMREIAAGNDSANPLADNDTDLAAAVVFLLERRVDSLARDRARMEEFNELKLRVEELERKLKLT